MNNVKGYFWFSMQSGNRADDWEGSTAAFVENPNYWTFNPKHKTVNI